MDYKKAHDKIILNAQSKLRKRDTSLFEEHHIIPRCMNGKNDKSNLVFLTFREHYFIHKMLTYIYPKERGLIYAFHLMSCFHRGKKKYKVSLRDYEYAKQKRIEMGVSKKIRAKISVGGLGRKWSESSKLKVTGKNNHQYNKKGNLSPMFNIKRTNETIQKMKDNHKDVSGKNNPFFGLKHTKEFKQSIKDRHAKNRLKKLNNSINNV